METLIGSVAALLTTVAFLPQALRIIRTRDASAVSLVMYLIFGTGVLLWLVFGIMIVNWPLIGANAVTLTLVVAIIALKIRYG